MKTFRTLYKIELKLSLRGMDMVIFAVCLPVVMVFILGMLYGEKPAFPGSSYTFLEQSFGALTTIAVCAGGVMGLPLLVSDYRQKKVLKRFQVTPVSPVMLLAVHVAIYSTYSLVSLVLVYVCSVLFFGCRMQGSAAFFFLSYLLVMLSMFSIGMMVGGWRRIRRRPASRHVSFIFPCCFCPEPPCLTRSCPPYCSGSLIFCLLHRELSC